MLPVTSLSAPATSEEMAQALAESSRNGQSVSLAGNNSKRLMAGPCAPSDTVLSTSRLNRVLQYEPNDLTISVGAGVHWADLQELLAKNRQMVALDPPFFSEATVGGVIASNSNGSFRRNYGTARDLVIGMQFAMLDGKLIQCGGMVVKNVAGLDMGKLLIGSFGTLAVITYINFRLHALPEEYSTFLFTFPELEPALQQRDAIMRSALRPLALDLISPPVSALMGKRDYVLAVRAGGSPAVLARYERELPGSERLSGQDDEQWWATVREFPADFFRRQQEGVVLRFSTKLTAMTELLRQVPGAFIARAASGISYVYLSSWQPVASLWRLAAHNGWNAVVEFASDDVRANNALWLPSQAAFDQTFEVLQKVKRLFDPANLLNRGRLYGRI